MNMRVIILITMLLSIYSTNALTEDDNAIKESVSQQKTLKTLNDYYLYHQKPLHATLPDNSSLEINPYILNIIVRIPILVNYIIGNVYLQDKIEQYKKEELFSFFHILTPKDLGDLFPLPTDLNQELDGFDALELDNFFTRLQLEDSFYKANEPYCGYIFLIAVISFWDTDKEIFLPTPIKLILATPYIYGDSSKLSYRFYINKNIDKYILEACDLGKSMDLSTNIDGREFLDRFGNFDRFDDNEGEQVWFNAVEYAYYELKFLSLKNKPEMARWIDDKNKIPNYLPLEIFNLKPDK